MKISSIMRLTLLIRPIVLSFLRPLSLAGRIGYGKMMQVPGCLDAGLNDRLDVLMQGQGWCDAGPWMV